MAERLTVAKLGVRIAALEGTKPLSSSAELDNIFKRLALLETPTRTELQLAAKVDELEKRVNELEKYDRDRVIYYNCLNTEAPVPPLPIMPQLFMQFAHYTLPSGLKKGEIRIARILGQGTKGLGYANLRLELNGDEGWDADTLIAYNVPYVLSHRPRLDTWNLGV